MKLTLFFLTTKKDPNMICTDKALQELTLEPAVLVASKAIGKISLDRQDFPPKVDQPRAGIFQDLRVETGKVLILEIFLETFLVVIVGLKLKEVEIFPLT